MTWLAILSLSLLFVSHVLAGVVSDAFHLIRRDSSMESVAASFHREIDRDLEWRQSSTLAASLNISLWDVQTQKACAAQLSSLNGVASNAAGMAICYNIPSLNATDGSFFADLRLYVVASPTGDFAGIPIQDLFVNLQYQNAMISQINASSLWREGATHSFVSRPSIRSEKTVQKRVLAPILVESYAFYGQNNMSLLKTSMSVHAYKVSLTPSVSLSAISSAGAMVNTTLSCTEASFITGELSAQPTTIRMAVPQMKGIAAKVVQPGTIFRVPGTKILIFPIAGVVTGSWAMLFIATVTWGTFGRMQSREQHRRSMARAEKGKQPRI
ncbi:MAG: hypothetical protein M1818_004302 [Claussenomyces sp. TS43310]|nr:MAG: hypothetical protein M1818_004302 [Claussenomyces sp. TS43310]